MRKRTKTAETIFETTNYRSDIRKTRLQKLIDAYIRFKDVTIKAPESIHQDLVAMEKWHEVMNLYKRSNINILTSGDVGILERYVQTYSEYRLLQEARNEIINLAATPLMATVMIEEHKIDAKMTSKCKLLLPMETQLFLTPMSKSRAIPRKKRTEEKNRLQQNGFGDL